MRRIRAVASPVEVPRIPSNAAYRRQTRDAIPHNGIQEERLVDPAPGVFTIRANQGA